MELATATREEARLASLDACSIMHTPRDPALDAIVFTVAQLFRAPMASLALVGREHVWAKSIVGPLDTERSRVDCVCPLIVAEDKVMVIEDTLLDQRLSQLSFVTGEPRVRMIAGAPLYGPGRQPIGALCIFDRVARSVPDRHRLHLQQLAEQAGEILRLRVPGLDVSK